MHDDDASLGMPQPLCPTCRRPLRETLRLETVEAIGGTQVGAAHTDVTFCGACGTTLSAVPSWSAVPPALARDPLEVPVPDNSESPEGRFQLRCRDLIDQIRVVGFTPGGWIGLIRSLGAVGAARKLLADERILPVTPWLVQHRRVDLTMEHEITRDEWSDLFSDEDRAAAEQRLRGLQGPV